MLSPAELQGETNRISWFEAPNDPAQLGWVEHVVDASVEAVHHFVGAGDFDSDGDVDIAAAEMQQGSDPDEIKNYRNDGGAFSKVVIATGGSHSMRVVDIDLDGDLDGDQDLLTGTVWLDNYGPDFSARVLHPTSDSPDRNRLADIDGDGRLDAVVGYEAISTTGIVAWYRQPLNPGGLWSETVIAQVTGPMSLDVADMDRDGDLDVVVGEHDLSSPGSAGLFVFENIDGEGGTWAQHTVHVGDEHHDGAQLIDIDRDGDLDIVSIGWGHSRVLLSENRATMGGGTAGTSGSS
ncbi:MAG: VCBS repeat-containing protein, partial [Polyangiales bacterium]